MYCAAFGLVSEMLFRASGMNAPGFARDAPAATIAIQGEDATLLILSIVPATRCGSAGRLKSRTTKTSASTPAITSMIATGVLGVFDLGEAAAFPEHECRYDANDHRDGEGAEEEPEAGAPRPLAEHERENAERERRRREHRGERDEPEFDVNRFHRFAL